MKKPITLVVDDDASVLGAIERDLLQYYRADYRVLRAGSAAEGLEAAKELAARNAQVALFLVDQRMPGMSGIELLGEVMKLHPESRRVLLTAYADTDAAIAGINSIGVDHYLMKPSDPREERLYPILDDLLTEWRARVRPARRPHVSWCRSSTTDPAFRPRSRDGSSIPSSRPRAWAREPAWGWTS